MDLTFTPEETAFREEVRSFVADKLPGDVARKILEHRRIEKDDVHRWHRALYEKGWIAGFSLTSSLFIAVPPTWATRVWKHRFYCRAVCPVLMAASIDCANQIPIGHQRPVADLRNPA